MKTNLFKVLAIFFVASSCSKGRITGGPKDVRCPSGNAYIETYEKSLAPVDDALAVDDKILFENSTLSGALEIENTVRFDTGETLPYQDLDIGEAIQKKVYIDFAAGTYSEDGTKYIIIQSEEASAEAGYSVFTFDSAELIRLGNEKIVKNRSKNISKGNSTGVLSCSLEDASVTIGFNPKYKRLFYTRRSKFRVHISDTKRQDLLAQ